MVVRHDEYPASFAKQLIYILVLESDRSKLCLKMPSLKFLLHPSSYRKVKISSDDDFDKDHLLKQSLDGDQSLSASIDELVGNTSRAKLTQQRLLLLNIIIFMISFLTITTSLLLNFNKSGLFGKELNKLLKLTSESCEIPKLYPWSLQPILTRI